jgi:hypothetical protein
LNLEAHVHVLGEVPGGLPHIGLPLIDHTRRGYHPKNALLMPDESGVWKPQPVASQAQATPGLMIYRFTHSMYYANSQQLSEEVKDKSRYELRQLFGDDAFFDTLGDVMQAYQAADKPAGRLS